MKPTKSHEEFLVLFVHFVDNIFSQSGNDG